MDTFHLKIVKPEKIVYEADVQSVAFPTPLGETMLLAHHEPMVMQLSIGEMKVRTAEKEERMALAGGVVQVKNNEVVILANRAEHVLELDIKRAKDARNRVAAELEKLSTEHPSYEGLLQKLHKENNRVHLAEKHSL